MKSIFLFFLLVAIQIPLFSQNGYRLEFEDVITLSVDSMYIPASPSVRIKSFTVPQGTVLKISGGQISSSGQYPGGTSNHRIMSGYIKIDDNFIFGADSVTTSGTSTFNGVYWRSTYRINPERAIWAPSGSTVVLGVETHLAGPWGSAFLASNWITGVLYRKVPN